MTSSEALLEELEAVEAILMEGIDVEHDTDGITVVRIRVDPKTASDDEKKYVSLVLETRFPSDYPDVSPTVQVIKYDPKPSTAFSNKPFFSSEILEGSVMMDWRHWRRS